MKRWILVAALAALAGFALLHAMGGRELVGVLSGTLPATTMETWAGLAYVAAYFTAVLLVPIALSTLTLTAVCGKIANHRWLASRRR